MLALLPFIHCNLELLLKMAFHTNHWLGYANRWYLDVLLSKTMGVQWHMGFRYSSYFICYHYFGTAIAFCAYLESTKYLSPTKISVFASLEPFSSIILSIIFLNISFGLFELIGAIIIILAVTILSK